MKVKNSLKLSEIISLYETRLEEFPSNFPEKTKNDIETINVDMKRTFIFDNLLTEDEKELFRKDLKKLLLELPLTYIQSMSSIVGIFMYFYYKKETLIKNAEKQFESKNIKKDSLYDEETFDLMLKTIYTILKNKYEPLINDNFKLYFEYNKIFLKYMEEKKNMKISFSKSLIYVNSTLTWFTRNLSNIDEIYDIFSVIISHPVNSVFLILIEYFENVDKKEKIKIDKNHLMEIIFELEKNFLEIQENEKIRKKNNLKYLCGFLIVIFAAIFIGLNFKRCDPKN